MLVPIAEMQFRKKNNLVLQKMQERGQTFLTSVIAANRTNDASLETYQSLMNPSIRAMAFWKLKDIDVAAARIAKAKINGERIGLLTDFDVDGILSAVVMKLALTEHMGFSVEDVDIFVNNRMLDGYGVTEKALLNFWRRAGDNPPTLLISADQGSNDSDTFGLYKKQMAERGVDYADVIVTDHHHIDNGNLCEEAIAFVNPQRPDDEFEDKTICGCVVALLVMSAAHRHMIEEGIISKDSPRLTKLLTYASLATVADCVSLSSGYNRCIVRMGLKDMNEGVIPAWKVLKRKLNKPSELVTAKDLGFTLGPAINADSRTGGDGSDAIKFLMAKTDDEAEKYYEALLSRNTRRKEIDASMQEAAVADASRQYYEDGKRAIVVYLPQGSHGIHGIVASRVKDLFHCPTIIFSPVDKKEKDSDEKIITGSGRCIDELSIIGMVKGYVGKEVDLVGGGHPAAMGLKIKLGDLQKFHKIFDEKVKMDADSFGMGDIFYPKVLVDHLIQDEQLNWLKEIPALKEISKLEPFGIKFEDPIFAVNGRLVQTTPFGKGVNKDKHLNIFFRDTRGDTHRGVVFHYSKHPWIDELAVGDEFTFAIKMNYDSYHKGVGIMIESVATGVNAVKSSR
jgi:single-stranded-DNA-specific exonuclease